MTLKEADRAMCAMAPVQICGTTAAKLGDPDLIYSRIAAVYKRMSKSGRIYFCAELAEEKNGRCISTVHADLSDIKIADAVPDRIRRKILEQANER